MTSRRFAPASLLLPLALSACAGPGDSNPHVGQGSEAITNVCPSTSVEGIDIAAYQHPNGAAINWSSVAGSYKFAIVKATESNDYTNTYYAGDVAGARAAGIIAGSYHFLSPSSVTGVSGTAQANYFLAHTSLKANDLPPMLDVETSSLYNSVLPSVADVTSWLSTVKAATGKTPIIYVGYYTLEDLGDPTSLDAYWINIPDYGACPNYPDGWPESHLVMWQFTSTQSVPGISGSVDADKFYGTLAQLQAFAGASADWGAEYVSQSWPLATTTMTMTVNQAMPASITLKNIGTKAWDHNTRLGTTVPRDRTSPFAGSDWVAPNRPAGLPAGMTVAPGASYEFKFDFYAPNTPGMFDEHYGVLEEGVHWFSDSGEGGPPDNDIEAKINVVEAQYHGEYVSQSFPTLQDPPLQMNAGETKHGYIELKNVGTATWHMGTTKLAPTPRDMASTLAAPSWLSPTRVSTVTSDVAPGQSFKFPLDLHADSDGDYKQTFSLVEESVTWFADAPKGGGPSDTLLAVHVVVGNGSGAGGGGSGGNNGAGGDSTGSGSASTGSHGQGSTGSGKGSGSESTGSGHNSGSGGGGGSGGDSNTNDPGGCSVALDSSKGPNGAWLMLGAVALAMSRRRSRHAKS